MAQQTEPKKRKVCGGCQITRINLAVCIWNGGKLHLTYGGKGDGVCNDGGT